MSVLYSPSGLWGLQHSENRGRRVLKLAVVPLVVRRPLYVSTVILLIVMAISISISIYIVHSKTVLTSLHSLRGRGL